MSSLPATQSTVKHTMPKHVKAATVNARRAAADKRLAAEFAARRIELQAKLDAIVAAQKAAKDEEAMNAIPDNRDDDQELGRILYELGCSRWACLNEDEQIGFDLARWEAAELEDLVEGMADDEYHANGAW